MLLLLLLQAVNRVGHFLAQRNLIDKPYIPIQTDPVHIAVATSVWAGVLGVSRRYT